MEQSPPSAEKSRELFNGKLTVINGAPPAAKRRESGTINGQLTAINGATPAAKRRKAVNFLMAF